MPTALERTQITHTPDVQHALAVARETWPDERASALLLHLIAEGARSLESQLGTLELRRHEQLIEISEKYAGVYGDGYLAELRTEWPE
jgi:hypothetical protein